MATMLLLRRLWKVETLWVVPPQAGGAKCTTTLVSVEFCASALLLDRRESDKSSICLTTFANYVERIFFFFFFLVETIAGVVLDIFFCWYENAVRVRWVVASRLSSSTVSFLVLMVQYHQTVQYFFNFVIVWIDMLLCFHNWDCSRS